MRVDAGLCETCAWSSRVESARGSVFVRCDRSDVDPRFRRYPPLPVRACAGYERPAAAADSVDAILDP